ncbi:uncharacterized protein LOC141617832 [Silene latifolia]|uniref:uncharacterized protein LOC141617832 n=1 Tax=Silene latifolia TaxID=37657 RepID=UPI003D77EF22
MFLLLLIQEADAEGWTEVKGKRSSSPKSPSATSSSKLQLTPEDVEPEIAYWDTAVVCYLLGSNPPWELLSGFVNKLWGVYKFDKVSFLPNGVFLVRFPTKECQQLVLQQGFPMFDNKPPVVKPWTESCSLHKERVKYVPTWLRLCGLPLKFWGKSSLEKIAGLIGKFIKRDAWSVYGFNFSTRLGFAHLLVEVEIGQDFPEKLQFLDEKGNDVTILVEYEWKPTVCGLCKGIGHTTDLCKKKNADKSKGPVPTAKPVPKPVQKVWRPVQRTNADVLNPGTSQVAQPAEVPFGGPTYHDSNMLVPVSVIQQVTRLEHQSPISHLSSTKTFVAAVTTSSGSETQLQGRLEDPPDIVNHEFNDASQRTVLWNYLKSIFGGYQGPWCVCGDFNNVLHYNERIGGEVTWEDIAEFRECVQYCGLTSIRPPRRPQFRYYNMWSLESEYKNIVSTVWSQNVRGSPMFQVLQMHACPIDIDILAAEKVAADSYRHLCKAQHSYLCQKAKITWTKFGDENTQFFHNLIRARQVHNRVMCIKGVDGVMVNNPTDIEETFLQYYKDLLGSSQATTSVHVPTVRTGQLVTQKHYNILLAPVTSAEIKECIFSIPSTKSPGPNGFSSQFYKDSWDTVGDTVTQAIQKFFQTGQLLRQVNTTTLTLIPKVDNPKSVLEFRPVACCNIIYKAITKVMCNRLNKVLPDIINESQGGFVKNRNIVENVLICQDLVRMYNRKVASPRCMIKIDLKKAYDSVEWNFLSQMLYALKFPKGFINLVMVCVTSLTYSLSVNGSTFGFFPGKRGLRQGDPLSPLLFTVCMKYLSRILGVLAKQDEFRFHPLCGHTRLNHLLFADDLLLFCKGNEASIMWMLRGFSTFSSASGLTLNKSKSDIFFNGVLAGTIAIILQVSGFHHGVLPFRYLGVPISSKKLTKIEGMKLIDKILARIRGWGARHLSYSGRLVLVQSVLSTLHSCRATIFVIPSNILNRINSLCRNYLWGGEANYKRAPNVKWVSCCLPKEEGGLGLKDAKVWNKALIGKYAWWLATKKDHLWVRWVSHVYMKGIEWSDYTAPSDSSWTWKKITHTMQAFKHAYVGNKWLDPDRPYTPQSGYDWLRTKHPHVN